MFFHLVALNNFFKLSIFLNFFFNSYCCGIFQCVNLKDFFVLHERKLLWLYSKVNPKLKKKCMKCGLTNQEEEDLDDLIICQSKMCKGAYCVDCYNELFYTCKLCHQSLNASDFSDGESIVRDSSDESGSYDTIIKSKSTEIEKKDQEIVQIFNVDVKDEIEIIRIDKNRMNKLIKEMLTEFYYLMKTQMKNEYFVLNFAKIFEENEFLLMQNTYDLHSSCKYILGNFLNKIQIEEYFDMNLLDEQSFHDHLRQKFDKNILEKFT